MNLFFQSPHLSASPRLRVAVLRVLCPCFSVDTPQRNIAQEGAQTLQAQIDLAPQQYAARSSQAYGDPAYTNLSLQTLRQTLLGSPGGTRTVNVDTPTSAGWYDASDKLVSADKAYAPAQSGQDTSSGGATSTAKPALTWRDAGVTRTDQQVTDPDTPGLLSLYGEVAPQLSRLTQSTASSQRAADIADVANLGPQATAALRAANPGASGLLDTLTSQAQEELDAGTGLPAAEARAVAQAARGASSARGLGYGPDAAFTEALNTGLAGQARQAQRRQFASSVAAQDQNFFGDPFQAILGRPSTVASMTPAATGAAGGLANSASTAGMYNPFNAYGSDLYSSNQSAAGSDSAANAAANNGWIKTGLSVVGGGMAGGM